MYYNYCLSKCARYRNCYKLYFNDYRVDKNLLLSSFLTMIHHNDNNSLNKIKKYIFNDIRILPIKLDDNTDFCIDNSCGFIKKILKNTSLCLNDNNHYFAKVCRQGDSEIVKFII